MQLRRADEADLALIEQGERQYIREIEPASEAAWLNALARNLELWRANLDRTTIAVENGATAGYAMWTWDEGAALVVTIHVFTEFRRRGIGRRLLDQIVTEARASGADRVTLGVHVDNGARFMYEAAGFSLTGRSDTYRYYALTP